MPSKIMKVNIFNIKKNTKKSSRQHWIKEIFGVTTICISSLRYTVHISRRFVQFYGIIDW